MSSASGRHGLPTRASTGTCLQDPRHRGLQRWVRDLNTQYRAEAALHELDCRPDGFSWIEADNARKACSRFSARVPRSPIRR